MIGLVGGLLSGAFGVGGGILMVPLLITFAGMDQRRASAASLAAIVPTAVVGSITYLANGEVDLLGHLYGPGSLAWRMQLREVDRLVESLVEGLPPGGLLAVVADHGMVAVDDGEVVDIDGCAALLDGVAAIGGEPRARYVYADDGAAESVLATWREVLADRAWVASRDEASAAGSPPVHAARIDNRFEIPGFSAMS